jgi:hypothetical protein
MNFFFFVEVDFEPCNFFNAPYLLEICHIMIFSSTCEMKLIAYHSICNVKNMWMIPSTWIKLIYNYIAINMQLICH